jgi:hypothetical protein
MIKNSTNSADFRVSNEAASLVGVKLVSFDSNNNFESEVITPLCKVVPGLEKDTIFSKRGWKISTS